MEENKNPKTLQFTKEELAQYVERSAADMKKELSKARQERGHLRSNPYDNLIDHFGLDPLKLIAEYELIQAKKSTQPSGIRAAIKEVVTHAINKLIYDRVNPPKKVELPEGVKVVTPAQLKDLPENAHLHVPMPEVPGVVMMESPSSKKGRRTRK